MHKNESLNKPFKIFKIFVIFFSSDKQSNVNRIVNFKKVKDFILRNNYQISIKFEIFHTVHVC